MYKNLEETLLITPENYRVIQKIVKASQEESEDSQEEEADTQEEALGLLRPKRASAQRYSFKPPIPLPAATRFPKDRVPQERLSSLARPESTELTAPQEVAPPVSPSLSTSNKDPH